MSLYKISLKRCPGKISAQDLYKRSLGKTLEEISVQAVYSKSSVGKIPVRDSWQDPCTSSIKELSVQNFWKSSLYKISAQARQDLCTRSPWPSTWIKMSTAPRRERSDTPKVPRGLHKPSQNEHRATTRAIWHAQSAERVARAISKWAPHHSESDLTGPKWGEGCASDLQIRTAPQREQSETHKVTRGLRKHMLDFPQSIACTTKNEHWKVKNTVLPTASDRIMGKMLHLTGELLSIMHFSVIVFSIFFP